MGPYASPAGEPSSQSVSALPESLRRPAFDLAVTEQGDTLYLRLTGDCSRACVGRVEAALKRVSAALTKRVVFDLRGLTFLDARGLKAILRTHERARSGLLEVVVVRPRGLASRVFTLTRVGERLTMVDGPSRRGLRS